MNKIDRFYALDGPTWTTENTTVSYKYYDIKIPYNSKHKKYSLIIIIILFICTIQELLEYVRLDNIIHLHACYWIAKTDSSVIYRIRDEVVDWNRLLDMDFDKNSL